MPSIEGYSERGVVNALFESIVAANEPNEVLAGLLGCAVPVDENVGKKTLSTGDYKDFKVYIEPSLSDFGNPDAVVFLEGVEAGCNLIFVEAKLETFCSSCRVFERDKSAYQRNASTVLHELFLKARFVDALTQDERLVTGGFRVYADDQKAKRRIGDDPVVCALAGRMKQHIEEDWTRVAFFALTTDCQPDQEHWETVRLARSGICEHITRIEEENKTVDSRFAPRNAESCWLKMTYLWSWLDIHKIAQQIEDAGEPSMKRFLGTIGWNRPKFRFQQIKPRPSSEKERIFRDFFSKLKLKQRKEPSGAEGRTTYYSVNTRRAVLTCSLVEGFDGPCLDIYLLPRAEQPAAHCIVSWEHMQRYVQSNEWQCAEIQKIVNHRTAVDGEGEWRT